jgi:hypothetical protein
MPLDRYFYSFSDAIGMYNINIKIAVKCNAPASCFLFPRKYHNTLEDKTIEYGYDVNQYKMFVGTCKIEPKKILGRNCILYCTAQEGTINGCKFGVKLESWNNISND